MNTMAVEAWYLFRDKGEIGTRSLRGVLESLIRPYCATTSAPAYL